MKVHPFKTDTRLLNTSQYTIYSPYLSSFILHISPKRGGPNARFHFWRFWLNYVDVAVTIVSIMEVSWKKRQRKRAFGHLDCPTCRPLNGSLSIYIYIGYRGGHLSEYQGVCNVARSLIWKCQLLRSVMNWAAQQVSHWFET